MSLPLPRYTTVGLDAFLAASPVDVPIPPVPMSEWTTLFNLFGTKPLLFNDDRGYTEILDKDMLRAVLEAMGRPCRQEEQEALLLVTPVPGGSNATAALTALLKHERYYVRQRSALALGHMGDTSVVPALIGNLRDSDNDARRGACEALGRLKAEEAVQPLVKLPWDDDDSVNCARVEALARIDQWELVADLIDEDDEHDAARIIQAMVAADQGDDDGGQLQEFLDGEMSRAACRFIATKPEIASNLAEAVVSALRDSSDDGLVAQLARAAGAGGEEGAEMLAGLLEEGSWRTRLNGCVGLGYAGENAHSYSAELSKRLDDDDGDVQREAALALVAIGRGAGRPMSMLARNVTRDYGFLPRAAELAETSPQLKSLRMLLGIDEPDLSLVSLLTARGDERLRSLSALLLGLTAPDTVAILLDALARDDSRETPMAVRRFASAGLLCTGTASKRLGAVHRLLLCHAGEVSSNPGGSTVGLKEFVPEFAALAAKDGDWPVRLDALKMLSRLGAVEAYRDLVEWAAHHDPDSDMRRYASDLIGGGWRTKEVGDELAALLAPPRGSSDDDARAAALRRIDKADSKLGRVLAEGLASSDNRGLARAAAAIVGANADSESVASIVAGGVARLEDSSWIVREAAADLLGAIPVEVLGEELGEEVVEALKERMSEDYDDDVKRAVTTALSNLGAPYDEDEE